MLPFSSRWKLVTKDVVWYGQSSAAISPLTCKNMQSPCLRKKFKLPWILRTDILQAGKVWKEISFLANLVPCSVVFRLSCLDILSLFSRHSVTRFRIQGFNKGFKLPQLAWINLHIFVIISMDFTTTVFFGMVSNWTCCDFHDVCHLSSLERSYLVFTFLLWI